MQKKAFVKTLQTSERALLHARVTHSCHTVAEARAAAASVCKSLGNAPRLAISAVRQLTRDPAPKAVHPSLLPAHGRSVPWHPAQLAEQRMPR